MFLKAPKMLWWELAAAFSSSCQWLGQPLFGHSWNTHPVSVVALSSFLQGDDSYHQKHSTGGRTRLSSCSAQEKNSEDALAGHSGGLQLKTKYLCSSLSLISAYFGLYAWNVNTEKYTKQTGNPLVKRHLLWQPLFVLSGRNRWGDSTECLHQCSIWLSVFILAPPTPNMLWRTFRLGLYLSPSGNSVPPTTHTVHETNGVCSMIEKGWAMNLPEGHSGS